MKKLVYSFLIVILVAFLGSLVTSSSVDSSWYDSVKPNIAPPDYVFSVVWSLLFVLIAFSLYYYWNNKKKDKLVFSIYFVNLGLNFMWSAFYFGLQNVSMAFVTLILIWISILYLIVFTHKVSRRSSYLLIPYLLWVSFAFVLNLMSF
jgi:translocator protein